MLAMVGNANRNFFYNPNGHLASSTGWLGNRTYAYDAFDRLKSTTVNGTTTSYLVNALDQRVGKSGPLGSFRYVYSGQNTLLGEHTGAGLTGWRNYLYLDGQPVALISGNNVHYSLHTDHLGRPELMTDANRAAVWKAFNGAYSRSVTLGDPTTIVLGFPGQQWDEETQSWYNGFRDYDPYTGRYIQSDPIGLQGGLNTYAYVRGNPVNSVDPLGLFDVYARRVMGEIRYEIEFWRPATGYIRDSKRIAILALRMPAVNALDKAASFIQGKSGGVSSLSSWKARRECDATDAAAKGIYEKKFGEHNVGSTLTASQLIEFVNSVNASQGTRYDAEIIMMDAINGMTF